MLDQGPVFQVDENLQIIKEFISNAELILKHKVKIEKCVATSDAIYFSEKNIPTIIMNPSGGNAHSQNEYVNIDSLKKLYEIYEKFIKKEEII